ncbi:MAG: hypothetical protein JOZ83_07480, partial [Silvibacterium sp.]|nr:hypothetical protein [Silvibacterium sp.]
MTASVVMKARSGPRTARIEGTRVHFSVHQCFRFDDSPEERALVERMCSALVSKKGLAVMANGPLLGYMLKHSPQLKSLIKAAIPFGDEIPASLEGFRRISADDMPNDIECVFLCETRWLERMQMRRQLSPKVEVVDPGVLAEIARDIIPMRAWTPIERNVYPLDIPDVKLPEGKDLLLLDCPARNLALMPNGLAYVNNALKTADLSFAVFDLDIVTYHRYHVRRLFDEGGRVVLPTGRVLPVDPWQAEHYDLWAMPEVIDYFMPIIVEAANEIVRAKPKVLGLSVQQ